MTIRDDIELTLLAETGDPLIAETGQLFDIWPDESE
jgi:hypothetical protein